MLCALRECKSRIEHEFSCQTGDFRRGGGCRCSFGGMNDHRRSCKAESVLYQAAMRKLSHFVNLTVSSTLMFVWSTSCNTLACVLAKKVRKLVQLIAAG